MKDYSAAFVNTNGVAFPGTAGKNATGPSATDGTEFIKEFIDDLWGFNQALLYTAGATPDGNAEAYNASQRMEALKTLFWPENHINGVVVTPNAIDPTHDIDISVGRAMDSTNSYIMRLESGFTKQLDAIWTAGSGVGGFYVGGGLPVSSTIYVYLIRKDSDGSIDVYADISSSAANIPAGYTSYRNIFIFKTDASGLIPQFSAIELSGGAVDVSLKSRIALINGVATSVTRNTVNSNAPANSIAKLMIRVDYVSTGTALWLDTTAFTDVAVSASICDVVQNAAGASATVKNVNTDASGLVAYRASSTGGVLYLTLQGYVLGRA